MANSTDLQIVRNTSVGLEILRGDTKYERSHRLSDKAVRTFELSQDGSLLAWAESDRIKAMSMVDYTIKFEAPVSQVQFLKFSPKGSLLTAWHPFKTNVDETNLNIFDIKTNTKLLSLAVKKMARWEPYWSDDEKVVARHINQELHFFEDSNFERYTHKFFSQKINEFSMATRFVVVYVAPRY